MMLIGEVFKEYLYLLVINFNFLISQVSKIYYKCMDLREAFETPFFIFV